MPLGRDPTRPPVALDALRERLAALECRTSSAPNVPTGWDELDAVLPSGGLHRGAVHEWLGLETATPTSRRWCPPLGLLVHLATQSATLAQHTNAPLSICWVGRRVWPFVHALRIPPHDLLTRSLFVDAQDDPTRLWASDLAARAPGVLVIADGSGFDMAATRRLQLAAEGSGGEKSGGEGRGGMRGWMVHLARPPWEAGEISAAATRWRITRAPSPTDEPRFGIGLLRSKGLRSSHAQDRTFILQRDASARLVPVLPAPSHRSRPAQVAGGYSFGGAALAG